MILRNEVLIMCPIWKNNHFEIVSMIRRLLSLDLAFSNDNKSIYLETAFKSTTKLSPIIFFQWERAAQNGTSAKVQGLQIPNLRLAVITFLKHKKYFF